MDMLSIGFGLLILAMVLKNEDLKDQDDEGGGTYTFLTIFAIILLLGGLGFLLHINRWGGYSSPSLMVPIYIAFIPLVIYTKGPMKIIAQVAALTLFFYVITGGGLYV